MVSVYAEHKSTQFVCVFQGGNTTFQPLCMQKQNKQTNTHTHTHTHTHGHIMQTQIKTI